MVTKLDNRRWIAVVREGYRVTSIHRCTVSEAAALAHTFRLHFPGCRVALMRPGLVPTQRTVAAPLEALAPVDRSYWDWVGE